jgi:hypothetical protein
VSDNFPTTPVDFQIPSIGGAFVTKIGLSASVGMQENYFDKNALLVYPNPNGGEFTIDSENGGVFDLKDIAGKTLKTYDVSLSQKTVCEILPAGIYERQTGNSRKIIIY